MSGETDERPSGWSVDTLRIEMMDLLQERGIRFDQEHQAIRATLAEGDRALRALIGESDRRYDARFSALTDAFKEADKRYEQRFVAQQEAIQAALLAQKEAVSAALIAADRAVVKAETANEKRFDGVNEFRATLADQAASLMPRSESEARMQALGDKLNELLSTTRDQDDRLRDQHQRDVQLIRDDFAKALSPLTTVQNVTAGRDRGLGLSWGILLGAIGGLGGLVALILALVALAR